MMSGLTQVSKSNSKSWPLSAQIGPKSWPLPKSWHLLGKFSESRLIDSGGSAQEYRLIAQPISLVFALSTQKCFILKKYGTVVSNCFDEGLIIDFSEPF